MDCSWTLICHNGVPPCQLGRGVPHPWGALGTISRNPGLTHTKHVLGILGKEYNMDSVAIRDIKPGEYFKRKPDAKTVYVRGHYDPATKAFSATDFNDVCREIFIKASKPVFINFDF